MKNSIKIPNTEIDLIENRSFILNYNFENLNAVFEKGCYIGQENTARQKYRGNLKFSLQTIKIIKGKIPEINEDICYNNRKIGTIKSRINNYSLCLLKNDSSIDKKKTLRLIMACYFKLFDLQKLLLCSR